MENLEYLEQYELKEQQIDITESETSENVDTTIEDFEPLINQPSINLKVSLQEYINAARILYGIPESTNFWEEYESYCSKRQLKELQTLERPEPAQTVQVCQDEETKLLGGLKKKKKKLPKKPPKGQHVPMQKDFTGVTKHQQIRKAKVDEYIDATEISILPQFDFLKNTQFEDDDEEWEDIACPLTDTWNSSAAAKTIVEKNSIGTMTDQDDEGGGYGKTRKVKEILNRYSSVAVKRKLLKKKEEETEILIPIRRSTKTRCIPTKRKSDSDITGEVADLESNIDLKNEVKDFDNMSLMEVEDDSPVGTKSGDSEVTPKENNKDAILVSTNEFYSDKELLELKPNFNPPTHVLVSIIPQQLENSTLIKESKIETEDLWKFENPDLTGPTYLTRAHKPKGIVEKEFEVPPGQPDENEKTVSRILEIKYKEWPGRLPNSKHKVRKYKFVTMENMIQEFIQVTYPTIRKKFFKLHKIQDGEVRGRPTPKYITSFLNDINTQKESFKPIVCKNMEILEHKFNKIFDEISPVLGKSYHDVQFEKNMMAGGPEQYLPSSFPASYCKDSCTLSFLQESMAQFSGDKFDNKFHPRTGEMIHTHSERGESDRPLYESRSIPNLGSKFPDIPIDMVFTVVIFHPVKFNGDVRTALKKEKDTIRLNVSSEVELLGSQALGKIRDMFICHSDCYDSVETHKIPEELTPVPNARTTKEVSSRCAFLVDNKVMVNSGDFDSIQFARAIQDWYANNKIARNEMEICDSISTRISDMTITFGEPYIFIHQENCQHLFQFKSGRVCHPNEDVCIDSFPRYIYKHIDSLLCRIDKKNPARWSINGFHLLPEFSMLLCTNCIKSLCFDKDGNKKGDFQLYQFNPTV